MDTLASPSMHGRGYVNKGDSIAGDYIKKEFEKFGLKPIGNEFYQRFHFPVNTFPGEISIEWREQISSGKNIAHPSPLPPKTFKGIPGQNYLVSSQSKSIKKYFKAILIDSSSLLLFPLMKIRKSDFLIINERGINGKNELDYLKKIKSKFYKRKIVIEVVKKLTWESSQKASYPIIFQVLEDSIYRPLRISGNIKIQNKFIPNYQSKNILGYIKGTQYPDSFIVFSAHYDHLGQMGKDVYFPGANDNASGCAMLLNLAKYYSRHPPKYSVAFMAFGGEEVGLLGSKYYVEHPLFPLKQIKFLVNMDIMGTGDEGIKVVNATEHKKEFDELVKINSEKNLLPSVQPRGKTQNSDHYFFSEAGVKTFFIYTLGGIKAYHDIYDRSETLPLTKFEEVFILLTEFTEQLQK